MPLSEIEFRKLHSNRQAGATMLKTLPLHSVGIEVGVYKGGFSKLILQILDPESLYLVDPWQWHKQWFVSHTEEEQGLMASGKNTTEGDAIYEEVKRTFANYPSVKLIRNTSAEASKLFADNYFDWVFIDGDHRYKPVGEDLRNWWPKIKPNGFLCGDDYQMTAPVGLTLQEKLDAPNGVRFAVDEFIEPLQSKLEFFPLEGTGRSYFKFSKATSS